MFLKVVSRVLSFSVCVCVFILHLYLVLQVDLGSHFIDNNERRGRCCFILHNFAFVGWLSRTISYYNDPYMYVLTTFQSLKQLFRFFSSINLN